MSSREHDAKAFFEEATRLQPDDAPAYVGLALSNLSSRELAAAEAALTRMDEVAPDRRRRWQGAVEVMSGCGPDGFTVVPRIYG